MRQRRGAVHPEVGERGVEMTDDSAEIERIKAEVRAEVALLTAAGQPGQLRRIVEEREPRVVRKPRILYHELEPVWDVGELVVTAVELTAGVFTDETTQMRMGISVHSE